MPSPFSGFFQGRRKPLKKPAILAQGGQANSWGYPTEESFLQILGSLVYSAIFDNAVPHSHKMDAPAQISRLIETYRKDGLPKVMGQTSQKVAGLVHKITMVNHKMSCTADHSAVKALKCQYETLKADLLKVCPQSTHDLLMAEETLYRQEQCTEKRKKAEQRFPGDFEAQENYCMGLPSFA